MPYVRRRGRFLGVGGIIAFLLLAGAQPAWSLEIKSTGTLKVPAKAQLFAVATDQVVQHVLDQDFRLARRQKINGPHNDAVTITVSVNQSLLMPGMTLGEVAPGNPIVVAKLLREAGEQPPPVGGGGIGAFNPLEENLKRQASNPPIDPRMQQLRNYQAFQQMMSAAGGPRFGPNGNAGPAEIYDTIIVAQASASNSAKQMTAIAVVHPGESIKIAKQLLAESIANAVLQ